MKSPQDPARLLQSYAQALSRLDAQALDDLIADHSLLEIPFLKPRRLVGRSEIAAAHREIVDNLEAVDCSLEHSLAGEGHAIAEGRLEVTRRGDIPRSLEFGMVVECDGSGLRRLSLYCNTRNLRRWSDKTIQ